MRVESNLHELRKSTVLQFDVKCTYFTSFLIALFDFDFSAQWLQEAKKNCDLS